MDTLSKKMPKFVLYARATLENVEKVILDKSEISWCLDISDGREERKDSVVIDPNETHALERSRGVANLIIKWPNSIVQSSMNICEIKNKTKDCITESDKWVPIIAFECRGMEPIKCHTPLHGVSVISSGGTVFSHVELDDDWCDYCPKTQEPVAVTKLEWKFERD